jgi:hypothetical protein
MMNTYRTVMDSDRNPLRHLPPIRRFQIMVYLSMMWTAIFCTSAGLWYLYDELLIGHVLVAMGVFITSQTFRRADKQATVAVTYRDQPLRDGSARYDDVWGG